MPKTPTFDFITIELSGADVRLYPGLRVEWRMRWRYTQRKWQYYRSKVASFPPECINPTYGLVSCNE